MMTFIYGLIIGLIVGWIIEWVIDLLFWRRGDQKLRTELAEADQRRTLDVEKNLQVCQNQLADAEATIDQLRAELNELAGKIPTKQDRLERVKGVGVVFAKRLNEAGIYTFDQLAAQTPGRIREIIQPEDWQRIEPEKWIAQAKEMADNSPTKEA